MIIKGLSGSGKKNLMKLFASGYMTKPINTAVTLLYSYENGKVCTADEDGLLRKRV